MAMAKTSTVTFDFGHDVRKIAIRIRIGGGD
jgi:hypothetical protein